MMKRHSDTGEWTDPSNSGFYEFAAQNEDSCLTIDSQAMTDDRKRIAYKTYGDQIGTEVHSEKQGLSSPGIYFLGFNR